VDAATVSKTRKTWFSSRSPLFFQFFSSRISSIDGHEFATLAGPNPRSKDKAPALTDCSTPQQIARIPADVRAKRHLSFSLPQLFIFFFFESFARIREAKNREIRGFSLSKKNPFDFFLVSSRFFFVLFPSSTFLS